jgi:hypothetical protein
MPGKPPKADKGFNAIKIKADNQVKALKKATNIPTSIKNNILRQLEKDTNEELKEHLHDVKVKAKTSKGIAHGKIKGGKTRRNISGGKDIVTHLMTIRDQVKLYHWQTKHFAEHKATDDLLASLDTNIDAFVESYMGKYGRPASVGTVKLHNYSPANVRSFVKQESAWMSNVLPKKLKSGDTDLLNIRDNILGDLSKTAYLFTLH